MMCVTNTDGVQRQEQLNNEGSWAIFVEGNNPSKALHDAPGNVSKALAAFHTAKGVLADCVYSCSRIDEQLVTIVT